ncbi:MAG: hypothetical protein K6E35_01795 [Bacteroidales bacterium]|nr:hypothetical protein [Bacteroidales bacterium]
MNRMIVYKEWLKTRWVLLGILLILAAVTFYCFLNLSKVVEIRGAELLWEALVGKDTVLTEILRYLPLAAGLLLSAAQFVPEVSQKRLKLTLHLPYPQGRMLLNLVVYGLVVLSLLFLAQAAVSALMLSRWVVWELVARILRTMAVWYLAGWAAYLFMAAICLEPTWKLRAVEALVAAGLFALLFKSPVPEAYNGFFPFLLVYVLLSVSLLYYGVSRFKEGKQD